MHESHTRSIAKTISWRLTGSGATFMIAYLIGGDIAIASTIAAVQIVTNTLLYFIHERVWNNIPWGRK